MNKKDIDDRLATQAPKALLRAQKLANITDTAIRIPGIGIKLGLDFLVGLIPVVGDFSMALVSLSIIGLGRKMGAPKALQTKMLRNALLDMALGMVPVVGDLFDIFFKANQRNVRLLEQWWVTTHHQDIKANTQAKLEDWQRRIDK